ncbi:tRNA A-37 threonylcarbamoyl transferase component Bud32 [Streptomyces griseochromogenes]|uniref:non-specific serine/threonine protein kinase n=1 Tax=Streptomyces griseochromogenes TaxID=68214 RepID=A0A1B1AQW9_9ACTN|nr:serine/threonine-protein kinase [Streptomyces griseochromogenes]ANP48953.1 serine/threonine protein kinase [Streptomyces griseochromogenes]MBP2049542.1 tRNA A-37 threonylcarbamoyl transferase component Bud32 [Streptomyces griseochromogenes]
MQGLLIAGRYRLADSIGSGGMGRVWRAHDEVLHRTVAVKELTAALYVSESDQAVLLARTRAEARAAARINHSAVVTVHDVLEHDGRPWIVMELVEGYSLADAVKERGRVEQREAARIGLWVLRALRAAHSAGVLHRDVKPGNVLLGRDGRVLLTDFGIAQIEGDTTITRTGEVVGSVDYLAPERVRGHDPGPSSDLWALGATLYTAVEGRSPFRRTSPLSTMQAVVEEEAEETRHAGPLGPVIAALLSKEPAQRPSAEEAEQMLAEAAEGRRPSSAQAFVHTRGSGMGTNGSYTSGAGTSGAYTSASYASGAGTPGYGSGPGGPGPAGGAAGRSVTGPTTVAPTEAGATEIGPRTAPARSRPRRRLRTLALVVAVAAVLGGGAAVAYQQWGSVHQDGGTGRAATPAPATSAASTPASEGAVPDNWERHNDPLGFSLSLPKGWKRKVYQIDGGLKQVDYSPDGGLHFVRIAIDTNPDFADAYQHQKDLEQQLQRLVDYRTVTLEANTYRDRKGSLWEYTWTALQKDPPHVPGPRHAIEETYYSREGVEYAIYMSTPEAGWAKTSKQFKWVLQSWQPSS